MPSVSLRKKSWIPDCPGMTEEGAGVPNKESGHDGKVSLKRLNYIMTIS
jgi:hypothetical protein